jgi:hypothetical protein
MKRTMIAYALFAASAVLAAQNAGKPSPYTGTSTPPPDTSIVTDPAQDNSGAPPAGVTGYEQPAPIPAPKPSPARSIVQSNPPAAAVPQVDQIASTPDGSMQANPADGTDDGIVVVAPPSASTEPSLSQRESLANDPDGDIVHPGPAPQGQLGYGTTIRVRLLDRLSTATTQPGEKFHTRVASDVIQNGQVLIPSGSEVDGTVVGVSDGHTFGGGSMHLRPETVTLPDGSQFRIYAVLSGVPGSSVRVNGEGGVAAGSQVKKDSIEYGGAVGAGAVTGAIVGGPGGALAGTIIGAGVITVHLLVNHPQATLDSGTVLLFMLDEPLNLVPAAQPAS